MSWINKEELIERAYEEEKYMTDPYHDTLGATVEWLAEKTTKHDESKRRERCILSTLTYITMDAK